MKVLSSYNSTLLPAIYMAPPIVKRLSVPGLISCVTLLPSNIELMTSVPLPSI